MGPRRPPKMPCHPSQGRARPNAPPPIPVRELIRHRLGAHRRDAADYQVPGGVLQLVLTVSPDRHWVLFSRMDQQGSDLMLVENFR